MRQLRERKPPVNIKDLDPSRVKPQAEKGALTYLEAPTREEKPPVHSQYKPPRTLTPQPRAQNSRRSHKRESPKANTPLLLSVGSLVLTILLAFAVFSWASSKSEVRVLEAKIVELKVLKVMVEQDRARLESVVNAMGNYVKRDELPRTPGGR